MNKKICFIIRGGNDFLCQEVLHYISYLNVPNGYQIEYTIKKGNIVQAYEEGVKETNAKYKVYLDENVFIVDHELLVNVIDIFENNKNIAMLGALGYKTIEEDGKEKKQQIGKCYKIGQEKKIEDYNNLIGNEIVEVDAIDIRCLITAVDTNWQECNADDSTIIQSQVLNSEVLCAVFIKSKPWCLYDND